MLKIIQLFLSLNICRKLLFFNRTLHDVAVVALAPQNDCMVGTQYCICVLIVLR